MATIEYMSREGRALPLQVISDDLSLPGATAYRILSSLRAAGYVDQTESKD